MSEIGTRLNTLKREWRLSVLLIAWLLILLSPTVLSSSPRALCQSPESCSETFLDTLHGTSSKNLRDVDKLFEWIEATYGQHALAKHARLQYGYVLRTLDPQKATPLLQQSLSEFPVLADYLYFWLLEAHVNAEQWQEAADVVQKLIETVPDSLVRVEALFEGGQALSRVGNCQKARSVLAEALVASPRHPKAPNALFQMGMCAGQLGNKAQLIKDFRELWWKFPLTSESAQAEEWLTEEAGSPFLPSMGERYQRAMSLYHIGALAEAIEDFQEIASRRPKTPQHFQAQYQLAKAQFRLKHYEQAEKIFQMLSRSSSSRREDALVSLGRTYLRQGKGGLLEKLVEGMPVDRLTGNQQAQLYTFYGIWLNDHERWPEAVVAYRKAGEVALKASQRLDAFWNEGWIQYRRHQFLDAINVFQRIIRKTNDPQSTSFMHANARARYWLARAQEYHGQAELARQTLQQLSQAYPFTYYGLLAQARGGLGKLKARLPMPRGASHVRGGNLPAKLTQDVHYQKLQALHRAKLSKETARELRYVYDVHGSDAQLFAHLASLATEIGGYDIGVRLAIRHFGQALRTGQLPPDSSAWAAAFPTGYQAIIQAYTPSHLDPFLVSGLIREESLYRARAISAVGAVGLMQLMPATARRVAHRLKLSDPAYTYQQLFQPSYNIQLGVNYLGQLLTEFQGNIVYAVAAYNAGPRAVRRWMMKNGDRPTDEFVESIGYRETRRYVKRVIGSYRIYRQLFGHACPHASLDRFC